MTMTDIVAGGVAPDVRHWMEQVFHRPLADNDRVSLLLHDTAAAASDRRAAMDRLRAALPFGIGAAMPTRTEMNAR